MRISFWMIGGLLAAALCGCVTDKDGAISVLTSGQHRGNCKLMFADRESVVAAHGKLLVELLERLVC